MPFTAEEEVVGFGGRHQSFHNAKIVGFHIPGRGLDACHQGGYARYARYAERPQRV